MYWGEREVPFSPFIRTLLYFLSPKMMNRLTLSLAPILLLLLTLALPSVSTAPPAALSDRSPSDLALSADGAFAVTANTTANTVSLLDLKAGRVVAERPAGQGPFGIALSHDGKQAVVTNRLSDSITLYSVSPTGLTPEATLPVGDEPRGVALSPDGKTAFVALAGESALACVNLMQKRVETLLPVGMEPWHVG